MKKKFKNIESLNNYYYLLSQDLADNRLFLSKKFCRKIERALEKKYSRDFKLFVYNESFDYKQSCKKEKSLRQKFTQDKKRGILQKFFDVLKKLFRRKAEQ